MIVVLERDEAKGLQSSVLGFSRWLEDLRHGFHGARCRFDSDLDQIALLQGSGQSQHATGFGNGLQLRARAASVRQFDDNRNCAAKLNSLGPVLRMRLGEVCHSQNHYVMAGDGKADYGSTCPDSSLACAIDRT